MTCLVSVGVDMSNFTATRCARVGVYLEGYFTFSKENRKRDGRRTVYGEREKGMLFESFNLNQLNVYLEC